MGGITTTRDQIAGELAWLKEQGFVVYDDNGDFIVVTATHRGVEIANGRARHDGVQRPRAGGV